MNWINDIRSWIQSEAAYYHSTTGADKVALTVFLIIAGFLIFAIGSWIFTPKKEVYYRPSIEEQTLEELKKLNDKLK